MPDAVDEAAIRAAVLARLERRGFAPERHAGGDGAPASPIAPRSRSGRWASTVEMLVLAGASWGAARVIETGPIAPSFFPGVFDAMAVFAAAAAAWCWPRGMDETEGRR